MSHLTLYCFGLSEWRREGCNLFLIGENLSHRRIFLGLIVGVKVSTLKSLQVQRGVCAFVSLALRLYVPGETLKYRLNARLNDSSES